MPNVIDKVVVNGNTYDLPGGDYSNFAPIEADASSSSADYVIGDHLVANNIYCEVIDTISIGDAIVDTGVNANVKPANVGEEITKINAGLSAKVERYSGTASGKTYVTVDSIGYDSTNKTLGLKVNGADTVIPFSSASTIVAVTHTTTNTVGEVGYIYPNLIKFESNKTTGTYWTCPMTGVVTKTIFNGLVYVNSHGGNQQWWCEYTFNKPVIKLENGTLSYINANTATRTDIRNRVMFIVQ